MQESRLFQEVYYLLRKGRTTAPELAERFGVSVRTVYRDLDALSGAGIPVYAEPGRKGGIFLLEGFVLDRAVLSEGERQEILSALQSLAAVGNTDNGATLEKLSAIFRLSSENWYEVDFSRWGEPTRDNEKFEMLKRAVIQRRCTRILYAGAYKAESVRTIRPLKLLYKSRAWYLKAYCMEKEDFRLFKLNRILQWEMLEEEFAPMSYPAAEDIPVQENSDVVLRFSREMAYRVYDEFEVSQISPQENGDLLVSAPLPQDGWLVGFLLSFGPQVEIIESPELKAALAEQAQAIYEKNRMKL